MKQKWLKRIARALVPCFVFFVFSFSFAPKAYAVDFAGTYYAGIYKYSNFGAYAGAVTSAYTLPSTNVYYPTSGGAVINSSSGRYVYFDFYGYTAPEQEFSSNVKLYVSYMPVDYIFGNSTTGIGSIEKSEDFMNLDAWEVSYINSYGQTGYVEGGLSSFKTFTPSNNNTFFREGYALEAEWQSDSVYPIRSLSVKRVDGSGMVNNSGSTKGVVMQFPSIRIITTEYTAEMEQLDKVADAIIEQNDILLAMKGDLVAILQDIYQMTGDMYIAQNLLNGYVQQMLPLLESINTQSINIYNLLSSQLRALETAIETAATSIEAAISAQTAAMIAYLESVLNTGNEVPDDTYQQQQDAENILDQMESLEKPNVDTIVPEIGDYSDSGVSGVLSAIFSSNLIVTMMTLSASFAFGAYVLFGKRE